MFRVLSGSRELSPMGAPRWWSNVSTPATLPVQERCTALYGVPTMFIAELNHPMFDMFDLTSLRTGIMAGSLCPIELMRKVEEKMHLRITSVYGLTETSPGITQTRIDDPDEVRYTTVGREYEYVDVKIVDPETNEEVLQHKGEICCKGYNDESCTKPQATDTVIDKDGIPFR